MLAIKFTYNDIKEGREFKSFNIIDPSSATPVSQVDKLVRGINDEDPDLNELRFKTGIKEIYAIIDMGSWNHYWDVIKNHTQDLINLNAQLATDPTVLKSISDYEKDQKQFRIWQAADKWEV